MPKAHQNFPFSIVNFQFSSALCIFLSNVQRLTSFKVPSFPFLPFLPSRITALRCATFVIRRLAKAVKLQNNPYYARPFLLCKGSGELNGLLRYACDPLPCGALHKHHEPPTDYCTSLRYVCDPLSLQGSKVAKQSVLRTTTFCCTKGAYVSKFTGPFVQQKPLFRVACFATLLLLWELTDSNRRPSACKADALNQLS